MREQFETGEFDIAVTGIACHFPMADSPEEFWENLRNGRDCITRCSEKKDYGWVSAYGQLQNVYDFDYRFFGFSKQEASMMDPQQRLFMQTVYEAMEDGGCIGGEAETIGLFAGSDEFKYVWERILGGERQEMEYTVRKLFLNSSFVSRICYALDLTGPGMNLKAACATSLAAVHYACQSLLNYECDVCIAGGSSVYMPQDGYYHAEGTISSDGYTRSFDKKGDGFVPGNGVGAVVLKRLEDAQRDHDRIYAVIKGSAINNDGSQKATYSAPGLDGEIRAITEAYARADIDPADVSYVECHGTATVLGDATEIQAMETVLSPNRQKKCRIGSVKSNVGHLNYTAGVAAFIKTALMLYHEKFVPTIHVDTVNEALEHSCLEIADCYCDWNAERKLAGVSSFGIGGTNCHVVLEAYPNEKPVQKPEQDALILLSAKSEDSLKNMVGRYADFLEQHSTPLENIAWELENGRRTYRYRAAFAGNRSELIQEMKRSIRPCDSRNSTGSDVIFVFSGSNAVNGQKILEMYALSEDFKVHFDACCAGIQHLTGCDVLMHLRQGDLPEEYLMAVTFSFGYSAAKMWMQLGLVPKAVMGYSLGEYIAACVSGIFSLEDALMLCLKRAELFAKTPEGGMLTVIGEEAEIQTLLNQETEISAVNAPSRLTVSGTAKGIATLKETLEHHKIAYVEMPMKRGGHYFGVECICDAFRQCLATVRFQQPQITMRSTCMTGTQQPNFTDAEYWVAQTRNRVDFKGAIAEIDKEQKCLFFEIGLTSNLDKKIKKIRKKNKHTTVLSMFGDAENKSTAAQMMETIGHIWCSGNSIQTAAFSEQQECQKVSLPTYAWDTEYCYQKLRKVQRYETETEKEETVPASSSNPVNSQYTALIALVQDAANIEIKDEKESLFDHEIDSLAALVIATEIRNHYGIAFDVNELFDINTIAELYEVIQKRAGTSSAQETIPETVQSEQQSEETNTERTKDINDLLAML